MLAGTGVRLGIPRHLPQHRPQQLSRPVV